MANKKISELTAASDPDGTELIEGVQGGTNVKFLTSQLGATREFNRAFSETINFDKNEILYSAHVATGNLSYEIGTGNLVNQISGVRQIVTLNGSQSLNFGTGFEYLYGITNGEILEAGTYEIYFLYTNGSVSVNVPGVSSQSSSSGVLASPNNFAAVADGETAIDLSWTNVTNNEGYLIEFSLTGTGGWSTLETTAVDAVASTQTGLSAGNTRYYRIKTLGNGTTTLDSGFSTVISGQTESGADVTPPTFTFLPANGNSNWTVNKPLTITANEPLRNTDGSEITNANVASRITLKQTNSGGANISFTATIDGAKQIITITPATQYGENQLVYLAINNVEDVNGNEVTVAQSITFTTTEFTFFNGTSNRLIFGDILDSLFATADTNFWIEHTVNDLLLSGNHFLLTKYDSPGTQAQFHYYHSGTDVYFGFTGALNGTITRLIKWTNVLTAGEHTLVLKMDMSVDTNNGLDRVTLLIDTVDQVAAKSMAFTNGILQQSIPNGNAQLAVGIYVNNAGTPIGTSFLSGEVKDFIIRSTAGSVVEINIPNLKLGTDTSGNARHGTWV